MPIAPAVRRRPRATTVPVPAIPPVKITSFTAAKSTITAGSSTTITPVYVNATSASIDNGVGSAGSGTGYVVTPSATTTYVLTATGLGGPVTRALTVIVVPAASIASFTANPASIAAGASSQLTASFGGGTGSIDHAIGSITSGIAVSTGALNVSTTFTLTVTNAAGDSVTATATVTAGPAVAITSFTAAKSTITAGSNTAITPVYVNATSASIDNGVGSASSGTGYVVAPVVTTTYLLTATGPGGPVTRSVTVTVVPAASIGSFTANPASIAAGASSQLTAAFTGGAAAIDHGVGAVTSGIAVSTGALNVSTTFTLTVANAAGDSVTATATVTAGPAVAITSFTAARPTITAGSSTTVTPVYVNATSASIDNGVGSAGSGTGYVVAPGATTTYLLTATGLGGPVTRSVTITVVPAASIGSFTASPASTASGGSSQLTAAFTGGAAAIDHGVGAVTSGIAVSTGALNVSTTFTLTVANTAGDSVTATATVTAGPAVAITSFTAAKSTITAGWSTSITPAYVNATSATVDNGVGSVSSAAAYTVAPATTTTYILTANGPGGPVTQSVTISVVPAASITAFTASPASVVSGSASQLTASFGGGGASIDHAIGSITNGVAVSTGALNVSTTFTLTVTNAAGDSITATTTVTSGPGVSITSFTAAKPTITAGSSTTITPAYVNATSASIDNGVGSASSGIAYVVAPAVTTTYMLTAGGLGGPVSLSVTVTVVPAVSIASFTANPASIAAGGSSQLTASFGGGAGSVDHGIGAVTTGIAVSTGALNVDTIFTLTVTNAAGDSVTGSTAVTVEIPPAISYGGASYTFTVGTAIASLNPANSGGPIATWSMNPPLPAGLSFDLASGGITGTPGAVTPAAGYTATAMNNAGSSSVTLLITVNPHAPTIALQPASQTVDIGATPAFSVAASGTGPLGYQWSRNGAPIAGATSSSYLLPAVAFADSGAVFSVVVSDSYGGSVASGNASLIVRPDLSTWLSLNPRVAAAIRWQFQPADMITFNSYAPPGDNDKIAWASWSQAQKDDLTQAYLAARTWLAQGAPQAAMPIGGLTDQPANQNFQSSIDSLTPSEWLTPAYMWKLYIAHVAFSLALEISQSVPWSLAGDTDETLRDLFDSAVMAWYLPNGNYGMGTYQVPPLRANNRPQTAFAPPMWTYPFLKQAGLVGATRIETIGNVLQWMRLNMSHFFGPATFGNYNAVWQYRGWVPLSKIVDGTVDANNPGLGVMHWTAGCHGSVAFLHEVLRAVNVPVEPVWVAGHELAYFASEKLYLDHGDDPYNQVVKNHPLSPILSVLIDEWTYQAWFTPDLTINITDLSSPALANVGRSAAAFH